MAEQEQHVLGEGSAILTPTDHKVRPAVQVGRCIKEVPPAAASIIGKCPYYYQPLHGEYLETVEKVSVSSVWETVKAFATSWDPWKDKEVARRLLHRREQLIAPESTDSDWSRHGNFMMRHIGCGHKPPSYYVSYGYYYCSHYGAELFPNLSAKGKAWLVLARRYLQLNLEDGLRQNMRGDVVQIASQKPGNGAFSMTVRKRELELNDETFQTFAFKTHPLAYLDGGIAYLPPADLINIIRQPNLQEWGSQGTYEQAIATGTSSIKTRGRDAADAVSSGTEDLVNRVLGFLAAK
ncbi:hypothetical protein [Trinickia soli]|uniref:Uncharacterized protein n=1 Tax=Trinickia soli TaxID=380675 RepID=A0A2N7WB44_9BURK|nr:hypothetical protein [Trinickia soli]PMS26619.1 hypothetical protein C0Z19_06720 [Trinickia soli]CAB3694534.1 hypothetical protein LMG24076_03103 [Trinickia soli]